jgi:hypothetical protein
MAPRHDPALPNDDAAGDYLLKTSAAMTNGYVADCVTHACAIADLLLRSSRSPWIARVRRTTHTVDGVLHEPLIPKRFTGTQAVTWTTHYVCCENGAAYDPMLARPVPIDRYCDEVFGLHGPLDVHLSSEATAALWRDGALRQAFRPASPCPAPTAR